MRRLITITLLLAFLSIASGASAVLCARDCGRAHQHALPAATAGLERHHLHYSHHHEALTAAAGVAASAGTASAHCARGTAPALVERSLPPAPDLASQPVVAAAVAVVASPDVTPFLNAATPPGPPLLLAQLRI